MTGRAGLTAMALMALGALSAAVVAAPSSPGPGAAKAALPAGGGPAVAAAAAPGGGTAAASWASRDVPARVAEGPSPVVFPPQSIPLRFDHARHLRMSLGCTDCHAAAPASTSAADVLLPAESACTGCHAIDRGRPTKAVPAGAGPARCDACHVGPGPDTGAVAHGVAAGAETTARPAMPAPHLRFPHRVHAQRGVACERCHGDVAGKGLADRSDLPRMASCLGCHDGRQAPRRCATCHPTEPDGRLRTAFPEGMLAPSGVLRGSDAHGPGFEADHRTAGRDEAYCLTCHKRSECTDCHGAGVVRPMAIHPGDYVTLHAVDARRNMPDCSACHRSQSFCLACHQRLGVASDPEGGAPGRRPNNPFGTGTMVKAFHPPGWARGPDGAPLPAGAGTSPNHHAFQARRNIRSCASCHREETCLECHSTRAGGLATPAATHPMNFAGSARCKAMAARNRRACLKCHDVGAAELSCE